MILQVQLASKGIPLIYVKSLDLHQALDRTGMLDGCLRNMLQDNLGFCNNASRVYTRRRGTALDCERLGWTSFLMSSVLCLKIWCNMSLDQSNK